METKFKLGDRVISKWKGDRSFGKVGNIVRIWHDGGSFDVQFDEGQGFAGWPDPHFGERCWSIGANRLSPVANDNKAWVSPNLKPQEKIVLDHLASGQTLTRIQADHLYRIASLTKVISGLNAKGFKVDAKWKVDPTGRHYKSYSLRRQKKVG